MNPIPIQFGSPFARPLCVAFRVKEEEKSLHTLERPTRSLGSERRPLDLVPGGEARFLGKGN
jgi:hypothetical protein